VDHCLKLGRVFFGFFSPFGFRGGLSMHTAHAIQEKSAQDVAHRLTVVKIGGSSLADPEKIGSVARLVAEKSKSGKLVVVVSAMGKTTDSLLGIVKGVGNGHSPAASVDDILAMGERTSARVFSLALKSLGVRADYLDVEHDAWPLVTDDVHGDANFLVAESIEQINRVIPSKLASLDVLVVPGFTGRSRSGHVTTVGRGGSDTTAFLLADALDAKEVILVSDIPGIMTCDPKLVPHPAIIPSISAERLASFADTSSKFLHKKSLAYKPARVDARLVSNKASSLDDKGTVIIGAVSPLSIVESAKSVTMLTVLGNGMSGEPEAVAAVTKVLREGGCGIEVITTNHDSVIFYLDNPGAELLNKVHSAALRFSSVIGLAVRPGLRWFKVKGNSIESIPGVVATITSPLKEKGINVFGLSTIASSVIVFVEEEKLSEAKRLVSDALGVVSP
jgi:aspartate kinase